eukprot:8023648-Pyramimonas_sp.AAC.2
MLGDTRFAFSNGEEAVRRKQQKQATLPNNTITSFYGSSCASNGKSAATLPIKVLLPLAP